jgi:hypothetical protein
MLQSDYIEPGGSTFPRNDGCDFEGRGARAGFHGPPLIHTYIHGCDLSDYITSHSRKYYIMFILLPLELLVPLSTAIATTAPLPQPRASLEESSWDYRFTGNMAQ